MIRRLLIATGIAAAGLTFFLQSASADIDVVPTPPELTDTDAYLTNSLTVTVVGDISAVRAFMDANPLTDFLEPSGRIPRITDVVVLKGPWGQPGSLRRVDLEGGSWTHERVLTNDSNEFTYQIWNITTSAGRFIDHIYGEILFTEVTDGTQITWNYNVKPSVFFARPSIRGYLRDDFAPFMKNGMTGFVNAYTQASPA